MEALLHASCLEELEQIQDAIHDSEFDLTGVSYAEKQQNLVITFKYEDLGGGGLLPKKGFRKRIPIYEARLIINGVTSFKLIDTEKIGTYSINIVNYDESSKCVSIVANVPLEIKAFTNRLDISVEISNKLIGERKSWLWGIDDFLKKVRKK